jgi:ABC-type branched-subunit amino acid transport system ATPase component
MLTARDVRKSFGAVAALDGASVEIREGEVLGLVGPNGSGKSTFLNTLSGFLRPDSGEVTFRGERIERRHPWDISQLGLRRTFQLAAQPEKMTVLEVMLAGADMPLGSRAWTSILRPGRVRAEQRDAVDRARELLEELLLLPLEHHAAGRLSGGQQKLLSLGAALMASPRLLLLDEPTAGVNPTLRRTLVERLRSTRERGTTLAIVEHDMGFVGELCDRVYVLDKGAVITCCKPHELADDERVVAAYLGSARPGAAPVRVPRPEVSL